MIRLVNIDCDLAVCIYRMSFKGDTVAETMHKNRFSCRRDGWVPGTCARIHSMSRASFETGQMEHIRTRYINQPTKRIYSVT